MTTITLTCPDELAQELGTVLGKVIKEYKKSKGSNMVLNGEVIRLSAHGKKITIDISTPRKA